MRWQELSSWNPELEAEIEESKAWEREQARIAEDEYKANLADMKCRCGHRRQRHAFHSWKCMDCECAICVT